MYGGSSLGLPVTGTGGSLNFGLQTATGSYTVVATNISTSCTANMTGSATVSVSPLPNVDTVIGAGTTYCAGGTGIDIMLNGSDVSVNYQLYRGGAAAGTAAAGTGGPVDFGSHMLAGVYTVIGTNSTTGCSSSMYGNAAISISPAPAVYAITGGGSYCSGGTGVHINLSGSTLGVNYQLSDTSGSVATLAGSGSALDFGLQTVGGSYTVVATDAISGCMSTMAGSPSVNINALPMAYTVTGSGNYCMGGTGTPVYLSGSDYGMHYRLYNGSVAVGSYVTGTGPMIDFGAQTTGTYTVIATNPSTGCSNNMNSSAVIGINPLPVAQTVMGGGPYCAGGTGSDVALGNSSAGVNYTLVYSGTPSGLIMAGTGAALDFGSQTGAGTYTVVAQDTTTMCSGNMAGSAVVTITPQPAVETITGGGAYCAGGSGEAVHMSGSNSGIRYQLLNGALAVGGLVTGTGGSINFGLETAAGTYTVIASPGGLCQTTMSGSAMITVSPLPTTYTVMGGGAYCATGTGVDVSLSGSQAGIDYKLNKGTTIIGTFPGTGSALDFGSETTGGLYTVVATDTTTGCTSAMTGSGSVSVLPAPHVFDMGGGGPYCAGGNGTDVILNGSNTDVFYQLMQGGVATGVPMAGTGTILDFGLQTVAGAYTVVASDAATSCTNNMADTAHVSIDPIVTPSMSALTSSGGLTIKMGQSNTITATVTNGGADGPAYQWYVNSFLIAGATNATYTSTQFANNDTVACIATSTGMCGGQTVKKSLVLTVLNTTFVNMVVTGNSDVRVMPNPNNGIFSITGSIGTSSDEEVSLEVVDMVGHVVYIGKTIATNGTINDRIQLNGVANGMYLLNLRSNSVSQVFHIVVEQ